jgi:hypothetical protein
MSRTARELKKYQTQLKILQKEKKGLETNMTKLSPNDEKSLSKIIQVRQKALKDFNQIFKTKNQELIKSSQQNLKKIINTQNNILIKTIQKNEKKLNQMNDGIRILKNKIQMLKQEFKQQQLLYS